jgi:hypothetical protein
MTAVPQLGPLQPGSQTQVPGFSQLPCPEQQPRIEQSVPQFGIHFHVSNDKLLIIIREQLRSLFQNDQQTLLT